ncbi:MAG: YccF domain-containing protein [Nannocystaceae bacterium]
MVGDAGALDDGLKDTQGLFARWADADVAWEYVRSRAMPAVLGGAKQLVAAVRHTGAMSFLGNLVWLIFGGLLSALAYLFGGVALCLTIVGIPFGLQTMKIGMATLAPFGKKVVEQPNANSMLRIVFNVVWLVLFGWEIAVAHLVWALILAVTVIGLPFAAQHVKLIPLSLFPFGRELR